MDAISIRPSVGDADNLWQVFLPKPSLLKVLVRWLVRDCTRQLIHPRGSGLPGSLNVGRRRESVRW